MRALRPLRVLNLVRAWLHLRPFPLVREHSHAQHPSRLLLLALVRPVSCVARAVSVSSLRQQHHPLNHSHKHYVQNHRHMRCGSRSIFPQKLSSPSRRFDLALRHIVLGAVLSIQTLSPYPSSPLQVVLLGHYLERDRGELLEARISDRGVLYCFIALLSFIPPAFLVGHLACQFPPSGTTV